MKIQIDRQGEAAVLRIQGDIKIGDGDLLLRETVNGELERGARHFVLNLSGVGFIDSSGFGEMVAAYKKVKRAGGALKLAAATPRVAETLELTQLVRVLEVHADEGRALASF